VTAILVALLGAVVYGSADFLGGLAAARRRALVVTAGSQAAGLLLLVPIVVVTTGRLSAAAVGWGVAAGLLGATGVAFYYKGLAVGPMGVVAPVAAVVGALVPVAGGLITGERLGAVAGAGVVLAVVAVVVASLGEHSAATRGGRRSFGPLLGTVAGLGFGGFFVAADAAPIDSGFWPLAVGRVASVAVVTALVLATAHAARRAIQARGQAPTAATPLARPAIALIIAAGLLDQTANVAFLIATRSGDLAIVGVLISLYPVVVVALAAIVLRERLGRRFALAGTAALAGAVLIGVGA